jgi:oxepin-CoA hydrolase/3-oxo-5,6-dehydrosuberyl-CoA semialdehyde dehydrogenase
VVNEGRRITRPIISFAGLFVDPDFGAVLANYGLDNLRFAQPVKVGDSLKVRWDTRRSRTRRARSCRHHD